MESTEWIIKNNQRLRYHFGTSEVLGRAMSAGTKKLEKGNNANFILKLESPITVSMDDRFVIRSYSPMHTIAGGIVLYNDIRGKWSNMRDFTKMLPIDPKERFGYLVKFNWKTPMSIKDWKLLFYNSNEKIDLWIEEFSLEQSDEGILYSKDRIESSRDQFIQFFNDSYAKNTFRSVLAIESIKNALNWSDIWIDICLLYTSPSPRDATLSRMPW